MAVPRARAGAGERVGADAEQRPVHARPRLGLLQQDDAVALQRRIEESLDEAERDAGEALLLGLGAAD